MDRNATKAKAHTHTQEKEMETGKKVKEKKIDSIGPLIIRVISQTSESAANVFHDKSEQVIGTLAYHSMYLCVSLSISLSLYICWKARGPRKAARILLNDDPLNKSRFDKGLHSHFCIHSLIRCISHSF